MSPFVRHFTLEEAQALLPLLRERCVRIRALVLEDKRLRDARRAMSSDGESADAARCAQADRELEDLGGRVCAEIDAVHALGAQLKGLQPILVDFPAMLDGESVLLCWCEGEDGIAHFHSAAEGFSGRRPITQPHAFGRELLH